MERNIRQRVRKFNNKIPFCPLNGDELNLVSVFFYLLFSTLLAYMQKKLYLCTAKVLHSKFVYKNQHRYEKEII